MTLIGITGGVGMGKSTAQSLLEARSIPVLDTDTIARLLVEPGQPALREIADAFGSEILQPDGQLDRALMARRVFGDPEARARLEAILHPRIRAEWEAHTRRWRDEGVACGAVVIPLLFETGAADCFEVTVCVACSAPTQLARLQARGWNANEIRERIAAQWPTERKMNASTHVVWTEGELDIHEAQWVRILKGLGVAQ